MVVHDFIGTVGGEVVSSLGSWERRGLGVKGG